MGKLTSGAGNGQCEGEEWIHSGLCSQEGDEDRGSLECVWKYVEQIESDEKKNSARETRFENL